MIVERLIEKKKSNFESRERFRAYHNVIFFDEKGNVLRDGIYERKLGDYNCRFHIKNGVIDSEGNTEGEWAIIMDDGHTEFWSRGMPYRKEIVLPTIISNYGDWEEFWDENGHLIKIRESVVLKKIL